MSIQSNMEAIQSELAGKTVTLVAISKKKSNEEIMEAYQCGHRVFGENMVQELVAKQESLPQDISWHMVGHLQSNKVKYIAPFIALIESVDSLKLLVEINKHAQKNDRVIDCLLQVHIADEESKFGFDHAELIEALRDATFAELKNIRIRGLMGIATQTDNEKHIREEFYELKMLFDGVKASFFRKEDSFEILSMGMSSDYSMAIEQGSNMIRLGSALFGKRITKHFKA